MNTYPVPQTTFLRAITRLTCPSLIATFFQGGPIRVLSTKHPKQHLVRLAVNFAYTYAFMFAVYFGSLTGNYTLGYTSPFFMIILSALLLKETVGEEKWIAVAIGMLGVVVATPPGANLFGISAVLVLVGHLLGCAQQNPHEKTGRHRAQPRDRYLSESRHDLLLVPHRDPSVARHAVGPWLAFFAIMGLITAAGLYAIAQALRYAQASVLAPIDYSTFFWVVSTRLPLVEPNARSLYAGRMRRSSSEATVTFCTGRRERRPPQRWLLR